MKQPNTKKQVSRNRQRNTAMHTNQPLASREEIRAFVEKEYPELTGGRISIGLLGDYYRVVVEDASRVMHTIRIPLEMVRSAPIAKSPARGQGV
jgi:hypothetical protein